MTIKKKVGRKTMHFERRPDPVADPVKVDIDPSDFPTIDKEPGPVAVLVKPGALVPRYQAQAPEVGKKVADLQVKTEAELAIATDLRGVAAGMIEEIEENYNRRIKAANDLHKGLISDRNKYRTPWEIALKVLDSKISRYVDDQEEKRREAERVRIEAENEAKRIADAAIEKAKELDAEGKKEEADAMISNAHDAVEQIVQKAPEVPDPVKVEGLTQREDWKFDVNEPALVPREFLMVDEVKLGRYARTMKGDAKVPGVRFFPVRTMQKASSLRPWAGGTNSGLES